MRPFRRLVDIFAILRAKNFFRAADYAWLHLGSRAWAPVALIHYVFWGEQRGFRPTPFFDPVYFSAHARVAPGENAFAAFLRAKKGAPACAEFDEDWFVARHPDAGDAPWDYLNVFGLAQKCDPSPKLSLAFVETAYRSRNKRLARSLMKIFERRRGEGGGALVLRREDLLAHQAAFWSAIKLQILRENPPRHKNLVFVQTNGAHPQALHQPGRGYDLMLNYYQPPDKSPPDDAEHVLVQPGTKTTAIRKILTERPDLFAGYEYIWFLDDDIELSCAQIEEFFAIMAEKKLDAAQPALAKGSHGSFPVLFAQENSPGLRKISYVEIMAPAFSRRALFAAQKCFEAGVSGFGVDALIGATIREKFGDRIAVIDRIVARHGREIDLEGGALYRFLSAHGIDPGVELGTILADHGLEQAIVETGAEAV